jgi:CTD small phosphatase-like protein 2
MFTASHKAYADAVLDYIDPNRTLIHHRIYRDSCVVFNKVYIKDLRILSNRDLRNVFIVDNSVFSFSYQMSNGIPILPYYDNPEDNELLKIIEYMKILEHVDDVRY